MHSISNKNSLSVVKHTFVKDSPPRPITFINNHKGVKSISFKID